MAKYYTCWLHVPEECRKQLEQIVSKKYDYASDNAYLVNTEPRIFGYIFDEVKWRELDFLDDLHELGIPFNFSNDDNDPYLKRIIKCRFTPDGERILQDYLHSEAKIDAECFIASIDECKTPEEKLNYINQQYMHFSNLLTSLPWDNQVEYGKLYRTRKLIEPS